MWQHVYKDGRYIGERNSETKEFVPLVAAPAVLALHTFYGDKVAEKCPARPTLFTGYTRPIP